MGWRGEASQPSAHPKGATVSLARVGGPAPLCPWELSPDGQRASSTQALLSGETFPYKELLRQEDWEMPNLGEGVRVSPGGRKSSWWWGRGGGRRGEGCPKLQCCKTQQPRPLLGEGVLTPPQGGSERNGRKSSCQQPGSRCESNLVRRPQILWTAALLLLGCFSAAAEGSARPCEFILPFIKHTSPGGFWGGSVAVLRVVGREACSECCLHCWVLPRAFGRPLGWETFADPAFGTFLPPLP